jgi:hypothetical protein
MNKFALSALLLSLSYVNNVQSLAVPRQTSDLWLETAPNENVPYLLANGKGAAFPLGGATYRLLVPTNVTGPGGIVLFTVSGASGVQANAHFHKGFPEVSSLHRRRGLESVGFNLFPELLYLLG